MSQLGFPTPGRGYAPILLGEEYVLHVDGEDDQVCVPAYPLGHGNWIEGQRTQFVVFLGTREEYFDPVESNWSSEYRTVEPEQLTRVVTK